jgi:hypothetical protein
VNAWLIKWKGPFLVVSDPSGRLRLGLHQDLLSGSAHFGVQFTIARGAAQVDSHDEGTIAARC